MADDPERGALALAQLQAMTADICDVIPHTAAADFHITTTTVMAGNALLVETAATDLDYDRTPAHIARGGLDHYHITLCVAGEMRFSSGRREITLRPGDIGLLDMAQPNRTELRAGGGRTISSRSSCSARCWHRGLHTPTRRRQPCCRRTSRMRA